MGFEVGELFRLVTKFNVGVVYYESKDIFDVEHNLVETPLEVSYDMYVHEESSSLGCNNVLPYPLDHSHVSPVCSQPSFFLEYYFDVPIDNFAICDSIGDLGLANNMFHAWWECL